MSDNDCEGCGGTPLEQPVPGVIAAMDTAEGVQRCDTCQRYPGDLEAAQALANHVGGVVRFHRRDAGPETFTGSLPAGVFIEEYTNPWVEVDGTPVDWTAVVNEETS